MSGREQSRVHTVAAPLLRAFAKPTPTDPPASPGLFAPSAHLPRVPWDPPHTLVPPNAPVSAAMQAGGGAKAEKSVQPSLRGCAFEGLKAFLIAFSHRSAIPTKVMQFWGAVGPLKFAFRKNHIIFERGVRASAWGRWH